MVNSTYKNNFTLILLSAQSLKRSPEKMKSSICYYVICIMKTFMKQNLNPKPFSILCYKLMSINLGLSTQIITDVFLISQSALCTFIYVIIVFFTMVKLSGINDFTLGLLNIQSLKTNWEELKSSSFTTNLNILYISKTFVKQNCNYIPCYKRILINLGLPTQINTGIYVILQSVKYLNNNFYFF